MAYCCVYIDIFIYYFFIYLLLIEPKWIKEWNCIEANTFTSKSSFLFALKIIMYHLTRLDTEKGPFF